jgi:hypothetical protein
MVKLFGATIRLFAGVILISTTALPQEISDQIELPAAKGIEKHVHNYGDLDETCVRWTDKCRNCSRSVSGDSICSNIGIAACEPAEVECLERRQSGDQK